MAVRRARTYKLFRETKTKALNITMSLVMLASSLGSALPVLLSRTASASPTPGVTTPTSPVTTTSGSVTVTGVTHDSSAHTVKIYETNCAGSPLATKSVTSTFSVTISSLSIGTHSLFVKLTKDSNNSVELNCVALPTVTSVAPTPVDTTPPSVPTGGQPSGGIYLNSNVFNYTWTASTDNSGGTVTYEYQYSNDCTTNLDGSLAHVTWSSNANGSATQKAALLAGPSIPSEGTGDGKACWQVRAVDPSGNKSAWSQVWSFTLDSHAPATPTLLTPPNNGYETTNDFYFTWTDSSDSGSPVTYEFIASQNSHTTGGVLDTSVWDNIANGNSEQNNLTSPQIHSTGAPDGDWYWQVRALDAAGNKSGWSTIWKVTIDTNAPGVPTSTFTADNTGATVPNGGVTNSQFFTFHLSSSSDTVRYQLKYWNDIPGSPFKIGSPWNPTNLSAYSPSLGTYKDNFTQGEGTHYFAFSACDAAGNCSAYSAPFVVTFDKTPPPAPTHLTPANGTVTTTANQALIDWTDVTDPSSPVSYYYESSHSSATNGDGSFTTPVFQSGALADSQIPTLGTPEGTYYWHVRACDAAGNCSSWTDPWQLIVDDTAPVVTINSFGQSGKVIQPDVTATDANGPLVYLWTPTTPNVTISNIHVLNPTFTVNNDGTYTFTITATDAAGNTGSASFTFTYTTPPVPQTVPPTPTFTNTTTTGSATPTPATTPITDNGTGTTTPQVLGDSTTTPSSDVMGDSTVNTQNIGTKKAGPFLHLGWWWLGILGALALLWLILGRRKRDDEN